jgi:polar amino acid transport system permease protein
VTRTARTRALRYGVYAAFVLVVLLVVARSDLPYTWRWATFWEKWAHLLWDGLVLTLEVSVASMLLALPLGVLIGLCRTAHDPGARLLGFAYVELFRGTPLLVQVMIWYHVLAGPTGLERLGEVLVAVLGPLNRALGVDPIQPTTIAAAVVALSCFAGSYIAEIVRAGIQSVDRGQMEAARSLGLTHVQAMRHVILPQALRRILPPLASEFIALVKDSSLASVIGLMELTMATRDVQAGAYMTFEPWLLTAALYLGINVVLSLGVRLLERKLGVAHRGEAIR